MRSPNIWEHPGVYEIENLAVDPDGRLDALMESIAPRAGRVVADIGCGTGFHLPHFAATAAQVYGVEPHPDLLAIAARRVRRLANVTLRLGAAQQLPLADASIDVAHARWAYFFGPGCEPGLAELDRVVRRGGTAFVIDNDATASTFGGWFRRGYPKIDPDAVERFWVARGWERHRVAMRWLFADRADFEAVVRIEFTPEIADQIIAEHVGVEVDYAVNVWVKNF